MFTCADCEHHIFCDSWGEYKCEVKEMRIYKSPESCPDYIKAKVGAEIKKCHCKTCQVYGYAEEEE